MTDGLARHLMDRAHAIASELHRRKVAHESERANLQEQLAVVQTKIEAAGAAPARLKDFATLLRSTNHLCPECWIRQGEKVSLTAVPSDNDTDLFRCRSCNAEFAIDA